MMVQQGEGGSAAKSRRNGARLFKNPPQPHMCIQDYIQGSWDPCYVNVLSWGKIAMPHRPSEPVPLWGGMRVLPPRTEKPQCSVFAVMANPEILRLNGKNAQDPQERSALIDLLLDFVEAMNEGVVFTRCYTVLKDRDITGELKEVWMAVQVKRDKEQETQQETWIDVQPPAPQYPQFEMSQDYSYQSVNDQQVYQPGHVVPQQYHGNVGVQISPQDQYNYGDRGGVRQQNQGQQNCPAYPMPQYQFQQLPRQLVPQYINSNMHPSVSPSYPGPNVVGSNVNPNIPGYYQQYIALQQQMVGQRQIENVMHAVRETHSDMQQPPAMHVPHIQFEQPPPFNLQTTSQMNVLRLGRPHMGVTQKSNANKRQSSSPTHSNQTANSTIVRQPKNSVEKSPSKAFRVRAQRGDQAGTEKQNAGQVSPEKIKLVVTAEKNNVKDCDDQSVQVTDLDEELDAKKNKAKDLKVSVAEETLSAQKTAKQQAIATKKDLRQWILNSSDDITVLETDLPLEGTEDGTVNQNLNTKPVKTQILVLKRNSSKVNNSDSGKSSSKDQKVVKNAIRLTKLEGQQIYDLESERIDDSNKEKGDELVNQAPSETAEKKPVDNGNSRNGFSQHKQHKEQQQQQRPKRSQTVNNLIKNVFKINPSTSSNDDNHKDKVNNHTKVINCKSNNKGTDDVYHGYVILRKGETSQHNDEDVVREMARISIQDCKDTTTENSNTVNS
ncbi:transcription factor SPT20 homolog [Neodiprion pinetum]|uniref:Uncharacterized protein LOC107217511 n=1 Tax=Neodiprion lecontei TaxID=441921 RepID=A0A6J0B8M4_NEOLC|nr:uncharacterized protein LOC107217511 [Neodiprion lecontei]XP_046428088.1 uncharacterized protein LOC124183520 [Neodiprion fabricii]XP_046428089.1 uncharacterized protein LOC124183520 [Neodiprion fabricii]XP_046428090.1 uncharacterized protein LOC124183520 [Neodiprion fabricii]XP_046428091.1 uncharacterized protein LOC124183520 [Neodiprion fabricii]XP_046428092.1 uncharacterized protein LOC124183520 [Neodiprion fabricii]XP_046482371.1 uncharacterized protein LOC124219178 [Neodiprion pinetum